MIYNSRKLFHLHLRLVLSARAKFLVKHALPTFLMDGVTAESGRWVELQWPAVKVIQMQAHKYVICINEEYTFYWTKQRRQTVRVWWPLVTAL